MLVSISWPRKDYRDGMLLIHDDKEDLYLTGKSKVYIFVQAKGKQMITKEIQNTNTTEKPIQPTVFIKRRTHIFILYAQKRPNNPSVKGCTTLSASSGVYRPEAWVGTRTELWTVFSRTVSSTTSSTDRSGGRFPVPVGPMNVDILATKVMTGEAEIMVREGTVRRYEITVVAGNATVIADRAPRLARQVTAEWTDACVELLEDNGLGLDFTNLLGDDSDLDKSWWATAIF